MIKLTPAQKFKINSHTLECYPEEMCGILLEEDFIPLKNLSKTPKESFKIDSVDLSKYVGKVKAIVHSHTRDQKKFDLYDLRTPSSADMQGQKLSEVPWLIVGTEGQNVLEPLEIPRTPNNNYLQRPFLWFINDCYTLVQDYYLYELKIALPDHKIDKNYKNLRNVNNIFDSFIEEYKFKSFSKIEEFKNGDLLLLDQGAATCNHLGIYNNGKVLHQATLSLEEDFANFVGRINKVLRYVG